MVLFFSKMYDKRDDFEFDIVNFPFYVNMFCAIMSCWDIDIVNFSAVINRVQ